METRTLSSNAMLATALKEWWFAKSESMSTLCGEEFSHKEVVLAHMGFIALVILTGICGTIIGG